VETQPSFAMFRPPELQLLVSRPWFIEGEPFEFGLGEHIGVGDGNIYIRI
jgi:hypothetical protein